MGFLDRGEHDKVDPSAKSGSQFGRNALPAPPIILTTLLPTSFLNDPTRDVFSCNDSIRGATSRELYNNPQPLVPDIVLTFEDEQVSAHKTLLEKASEVFRAAFAGSWDSTVSRRYAIEGYSKSVVHSMIKHIYGFQELHVTITAEANGEESDVLLKKMDFCFQMYLIGGEYQIKTFQVAVAERFRLLMEETCPGDGRKGDEASRLVKMVEAVNAFFQMNELADWECDPSVSHDFTLIATDQETRSEDKLLYRKINKWWPPVKRRNPGYLTSEDLTDNGLSDGELEEEFEEHISIFDEGPIYTGGIGAQELHHWSDDGLSV
ncbi:hypothetical protein E4T42_01356 [Aureobasidium subglaciale]|uniref:BTB domain-containing protein n=1 Tax=Aureobasidium subglaciale (strain EXF-2481) TaxID=1043005 RepID=A0A074ZR12_AURSE|nr:uncharacterized protein AUEXF2481DRAFT_25009 [Aureobasidium subglaciale EXF-2481]KAI5210363.1 hypothetical protein E4T38_02071 [Aureobasidium subglaciale]KAI5229045.1 hypothetical protein E4T40_01823 [Aureobasidium subglaciale]KAI5232791.1 hypothetical protein E4T41_02043 [Aureobasidium subglaciale]KAI5256807.1 hypothetical protein E4T42_01356 [Aureobasidium subglaciale]KAI5266005.1 hypothetical protein E4T46_01848 [Aureobasidium subglaciale]